MSAARWKKPKPGVCRVCFCTQEMGCDVGCSWVTERGVVTRHETTLCSACSGTPEDLAYSAEWARQHLALALAGTDNAFLQLRAEKAREILTRAILRQSNPRTVMRSARPAQRRRLKR